MISAIFASIPLVELQLHPGEARDDLRGQIVGGRAEPAAGDDQVATLRGHEPQPRLEVLGAVADDEDVRDLDPERGELLETQGPLRSVILAVITSVPVTRIPARTLTGSPPQDAAPRPGGAAA